MCRRKKTKTTEDHRWWKKTDRGRSSPAAAEENGWRKRIIPCCGRRKQLEAEDLYLFRQWSITTEEAVVLHTLAPTVARISTA